VKASDVTGANAILAAIPLGFPWKTPDPFLFCVHHDDKYPAGNEHLGPAAALDGRNIGQDFEGKDGWRMYHGELVPGFPQHPHRGFETVTVVRRGLLDHSDSMGAGARYGGGDVQWLTAGKGILHAEMFPLLNRSQPNPVELFQIWLNLPAADKMVEAHFSMLWNHMIPRHTARDAGGRPTEVTVVAGQLAAMDAAVPAPPPRSWAARADTNVAIWTIKMAAGATWTLPPAAPGTNRTLYFFRGAGAPRRGPGDRSLARARTAWRVRVVARSGSRRGRAAAVAGTADRRARRSVWSLRHEHRRRDPPGVRRFSADTLRGLAVGQRRARSPEGQRSLRPPHRWPLRGAGLRLPRPAAAAPTRALLHRHDVAHFRLVGRAGGDRQVDVRPVDAGPQP